MQQAIDIIRERIEGIERVNNRLGGSDIGTSQIIVLEEIIEELQALGAGWIPVTERLPEESGRYLVFGNILPSDNERCSGFSNFDTLTGLFVFNFFGQKTTPKITHWQPLPNSPKQ